MTTGPASPSKAWNASSDLHHDRLSDGLRSAGWLLLAGLVLECVFIVGFVRNASLRSFPQVVQDPDPLLLIYGPGSSGAGRVLLAVGASFVVYLTALKVSRSARGRPAVITVFAMTLLFSATFLAMYPVGSQDLIHNIADARTLWTYHDSPLSTPPSHHPDQISDQVVAFADEPSYYGPLWYLLMAAPNAVGGNDLVRLILVHKAFVTVFLITTAILVYRILAEIRPGTEVAGTTLFAWNPLVLFEVPGNGHNDIVMVFFVTLAIWCALNRRWTFWPICLAAAVLVKYSLVILGPVLLVWTIRKGGRSALRPLGIGVAVSILLAVAALAPFWEGSGTLQGLQAGLDRWHASIASLVYFSAVERLPAEMAARLTKAAMLTVFLTGYGIILLWQCGRMTNLIRTSFLVVFWFLLTMAWWFLPWYVIWLMPLAALVNGSERTIVGITLSATAFLGYIAIAWGRVYWSADPGFGLELSRTLIIWTAPVIAWILLAVQRVQQVREDAPVLDRAEP